MSTENLVEFLNARLDELEAKARGAAYKGHQQWRTEHGDSGGDLIDDAGRVQVEADAFHPGLTPHIAAHDPANVLADIAAKRRILAEVVPQIDSMDAQIESEWGSGCNEPTGESHLLLKMLAEPFDWHEDYREEWRP